MRFIRTLIAWHYVGALTIMSLAALWHFAYAWFPNGVTAVFFPVNESAWEYSKLFLLPSVIFFIIEYFAIGKRFKNYIVSHGIALLVMPAATQAMFYFYRQGIGLKENLLVNVIITFISICLALYIGYKLTIRKRKFGSPVIAVIIAAVLFVSYALLTFIPPKAPLFMDPTTKGYGRDGFDDGTTDYNIIDETDKTPDGTSGIIDETQTTPDNTDSLPNTTP